MPATDFELEIVHETENPLLSRTEVDFKVSFPRQGTPNRLEVRKKLAALKAVDEATVLIKRLKPKFGVNEVDGLAMIYRDVASLEDVEPDFLKIRHVPKEEREAARNTLRKAKKKKAKKKTKWRK
ncbi:MAG: 30S ribosomal protein S24e [Promethearchaeota archaeon]